MTYDEIDLRQLRLQLLNQFKPTEGVFVIGLLLAGLAAWAIATGNQVAQSTCAILLLVAGAAFALVTRGRSINWWREQEAERLRLQHLVQQRQAMLDAEAAAAKASKQAKRRGRTSKPKSLRQALTVQGGGETQLEASVPVLETERQDRPPSSADVIPSS
jgi:apolipoprotein N-acyltransferase